jgi:hypothetical protein
MSDMGVPEQYRKAWLIKLPLSDGTEYVAFNGFDHRALVAIVDVLTRPGVVTPTRIVIEVSNV